jgi:hypothetical protein
MKISIIHPSRGRSEKAYTTVRDWTTKADNYNDIEYILSIDDSDTCAYTFLPLTGLVKILISNNRSAIDAINNAAKVATGDLLIVVSDDFGCPEHWDTLLLEALEAKSDFLVKTQDGLQPTLITLPIMDRAYYNRFGYIYHPDYLHMFSDQEMTAVGHMLGRVVGLDLEFPHNHYSTGRNDRDAISRRNDATWAQGEKLFNERLKTNFGIEKPVMAYSNIKWR